MKVEVIFYKNKPKKVTFSDEVCNDKRVLMHLLLSILIILFFLPTYSSIQSTISKDPLSFLKVYGVKKKSGEYITKGIFTGGKLLKELTLFDLKVLKKKRSLEKIYVRFRNKNGKKIKQLGYFHVSVEENPSRVTMDFKNVEQTTIDQDKLNRLLLGSDYILKSRITMDPEDNSTNITFYINKSKLINVYTPLSKHGERLFVLDIRSNKKGI